MSDVYETNSFIVDPDDPEKVVYQEKIYFGRNIEQLAGFILAAEIYQNILISGKDIPDLEGIIGEIKRGKVNLYVFTVPKDVFDYANPLKNMEYHMTFPILDNIISYNFDGIDFIRGMISYYDFNSLPYVFGNIYDKEGKKFKVYIVNKRIIVL